MARYISHASRRAAPGKPSSFGHWASLSAIDTHLGVTCPYVKKIIILIHQFIASRSNQGERLDVDEAEANRAVFTGVEK